MCRKVWEFESPPGQLFIGNPDLNHKLERYGMITASGDCPTQTEKTGGIYRQIAIIGAVAVMVVVSGCQRNSFEYGGVADKDDGAKYTVEVDPNGPVREIAAPEGTPSPSSM
jgi:hypothetical protein